MLTQPQEEQANPTSSENKTSVEQGEQANSTASENKTTIEHVQDLEICSIDEYVFI